MPTAGAEGDHERLQPRRPRREGQGGWRRSLPLQNHQADAQRQRAEYDEDEGGEGVKFFEPVVGPLPSGALSGAQHLTWNGFELARVGTERNDWRGCETELSPNT